MATHSGGMFAVQAHMAQPCEGAQRRAETTSLLPPRGFMFALPAHVARQRAGAAVAVTTSRCA